MKKTRKGNNPSRRKRGGAARLGLLFLVALLSPGCGVSPGEKDPWESEAMYGSRPDGGDGPLGLGDAFDQASVFLFFPYELVGTSSALTSSRGEDEIPSFSATTREDRGGPVGRWHEYLAGMMNSPCRIPPPEVISQDEGLAFGYLTIVVPRVRATRSVRIDFQEMPARSFWCLSREMEEERSLPLTLRLLGEDSPVVRAAAIRSLGDFREETAMVRSLLRQELPTSDPILENEIAASLRRLDGVDFGYRWQVSRHQREGSLHRLLTGKAPPGGKISPPRKVPQTPEEAGKY